MERPIWRNYWEKSIKTKIGLRVAFQELGYREGYIGELNNPEATVESKSVAKEIKEIFSMAKFDAELVEKGSGCPTGYPAEINAPKFETQRQHPTPNQVVYVGRISPQICCTISPRRTNQLP